MINKSKTYHSGIGYADRTKQVDAFLLLPEFFLLQGILQKGINYEKEEEKQT